MDEYKQKQLRIMLQRLLGMPIGSVRPQDNQPTEGNKYAIVQVSDTQSQGWSGGNKNAYQSGVTTLTIDFMGDRSQEYASSLPLAMQTPYAVDTLLSMRLGYLECSAARDLSSLEIEHVKRYQVKMRLSYATIHETPSTVPDEYQKVTTIDSVSIGLVAEP